MDLRAATASALIDRGRAGTAVIVYVEAQVPIGGAMQGYISCAIAAVIATRWYAGTIASVIVDFRSRGHALGSTRVSSLMMFSCLTMIYLKHLAVSNAVCWAFDAIMALELRIRRSGCMLIFDACLCAAQAGVCSAQADTTTPRRPKETEP